MYLDGLVLASKETSWLFEALWDAGVSQGRSSAGIVL